MAMTAGSSTRPDQPLTTVCVVCAAPPVLMALARIDEVSTVSCWVHTTSSLPPNLHQRRLGDVLQMSRGEPRPVTGRTGLG